MRKLFLYVRIEMKVRILIGWSWLGVGYHLCLSVLTKRKQQPKYYLKSNRSTS